jgi:hypothetical protein
MKHKSKKPIPKYILNSIIGENDLNGNRYTLKDEINLELGNEKIIEYDYDYDKEFKELWNFTCYTKTFVCTITKQFLGNRKLIVLKRNP